jgi:hypothetical protein
MKKKGLALIVALLLVFGLVACTTTTTTTTTTTAPSSTTTTTSGSTFSITLAGLTDVGFTEEDKLIAGEVFDLLEGVTALGSDSVDYKNQITFNSDDAACQITDGKLTTNGAKVCTITYSVVVQSKLARANRVIKFSAAPIVMEFTATTKWDNEAILGTNYVVTTTQGAVNTFYYWAVGTNILGTTGVIEVKDDKLIIDQEALGPEGWSLQTMMLTNISLEAKRFYKITFTLTSDVTRMIDFVTKAPGNDYDNDTHSIVDVKVGTHEYEAVFIANQNVLHVNILTGSVEGSVNPGRLEFSNFVLHEGPIEIQYTELANFFKNDAIAVGTEMEFITGTDADYVREFYYWDQSAGALLAGEYITDGFELTVVTKANDTWGAQLQWNDLAKAGTPLKKGANYKLSFTLTATTARIINVEVTGPTNNDPISKGQTYELKVGANEIVLEFNSKYNDFFMKIHFGNYGDLVQTGTFTFTNLKLFEESGAVEEPEETVPPLGNIFDVENVNLTKLGTTAAPKTFYLWNGEGSSLTSVYANQEVILDIMNLGSQFWAIQMKYSRTVTAGMDYEAYFEVYSSVARKINIEVKNNGYNSTFVGFDVVLEKGWNRILVPFTAEDTSFNLQLNLGKFDETTTAGQLRFKNFVLTLSTIEVEDYIINGDFATAATFAGAVEEGWALCKTEGIADSWAQPNYKGTETIKDGVMTITTTQKGGAVWAMQVQYNHPEDEANMIVGAYYRVELDVKASVATNVVFQLKGATDSANIDITYALKAGDNHVVLYYKASQERFRFFILLGLQEAGTILEFDNVTYFAATEHKLVDQFNRFGTVANDDGAIQTSKGDRFEFYIWAANWNATDYTGTITDGKVTIDVINEGDAFWNIQLIYRGGLLTVTHDYVLSFTVESEVARQINVQLKDSGTNNTYFDQNVNLVEGINHVVLPFVAGMPIFNMQLNLGNFSSDSEAGELVFYDFLVVRPLEKVENYFINGNFTTDATIAETDKDGWAQWKTQGIPDSWALPNYEGTLTIANGVMTSTTTQTGGAVWAMQLQYNHPTADMLVGELYQIEFDVNASVATTVVFQLKGVKDSENIDIEYDLVQGDNHVVLHYYANQTRFRFFVLLGLQAPGTVLVFDNFEYYQPYIKTLEDLPIGNIFPVENENGSLPFDTVIQDTFTLWYGLEAWNMGWAVYPVVTGTFEDGEVSLDITNAGEIFWAIQLKYKGGEIAIDSAYRLTLTIDSEVARKITLEIKNNAFGGTNVAYVLNLVAGINHIEIDFVAVNPSFGLQINVGQTVPTDPSEAGLLVFSDFMLTRPTFEVEGYIDNGDFATDAVLGAEHADGWAQFKTTGASWLDDELEYIGTEVIADGKLTVTVTKAGHEAWALQIQYNHPTADLIVGALYRVEFDVNASVATSFIFQMKHDSNANFEVVVNLEAGDNHVVLFLPAVQDRFRLDMLLGLVATGTVLEFDNFQFFAPVTQLPEA